MQQGAAAMRQSASQLTQSRYYSPAFNAAIFDGPVRIYFAQYQEALALRIYFRLQDRLQGWIKSAEPLSRRRLPNIFIMLYPTEEIFTNCFGAEVIGQHLVSAKLGDDHVVGVGGPLQEEVFDQLYDQVEVIAQGWPRAAIASPTLALAEA